MGFSKDFLLYWGSLVSSRRLVEDPVSIRQLSLSFPTVISTIGKCVFDEAIENLLLVQCGLRPLVRLDFFEVEQNH